MTQHDDAAAALEKVEPILQHLLERMLPNLNDNDRGDLEQDVRVRLLEALPHHNPARGAWTTYAFRVVRNRIVDEQRRRGRQRHAIEADVDQIAFDDAACGAGDQLPDWMSFDVQALGEHLTRRQREVYTALAGGGQKQRVALQVGIRPDSLSQLIRRIRERLTSKLLKPAA